MNSNRSGYLVFFLLLVYFIVVAFTLIKSNQSLVWDPQLCLKMADNSFRQIPFNHYEHPNPANISQDEQEFVAWWTPGQYTFPMLIRDLLGVKISVAVKLLTFLCVIISASGIYKLFSKLLNGGNNLAAGMPLPLIAVFALVLFTLSQPFFWKNILTYDGGGILMLAWCPWFIYWITKINRISIYSLLLILTAALAGFFMKAAFTSILMGALLYLFLAKSISFDKTIRNQDLKKIIVNGMLLSAVLVAYILITRITFLSHNTNISNSSVMGIRIQPRVIAYPVVAPVLGLLSLQFLSHTYQWLITAFFVLPLYYYLMFKSKNIAVHHKMAQFSFIAAGIIFFGLLYLLDLDVSYEPRHFMILSLLLIPACFLLFYQNPVTRYCLYICMGLYFGFNICSMVNQCSDAIKTAKKSDTYSGFQSDYPNDVIKKIHEMDGGKKDGRDIFYFRSDYPLIAIEVRNNRVLLEDNFLNFHFKNSGRIGKTLYYGYNTGEIYVVYPDAQFKSDSTLYLTKFEKYKKFRKMYSSGGYSIYKAIASDRSP